MRAYSDLPHHVQKAIDFKERCEKAREMASAESVDDSFYQGMATNQSLNMDKQEINSYIELA